MSNAKYTMPDTWPDERDPPIPPLWESHPPAFREPDVPALIRKLNAPAAGRRISGDASISTASSTYHGPEIPGRPHSLRQRAKAISKMSSDNGSTNSSRWNGPEIPRPEDPMDAAVPSALHDFGDENQDLKKMPTEPDVEHNEHAPMTPADPSGSRTSTKLSKTRSIIGLNPTAPVNEEDDLAERSDLWWSKVRLSLREPFAEFFGVFIMVLFGDGSVAQVLLSAGEKSAPGSNGYGAYQSISWGWGLGVMLGVYVAGDSGAYLNPAITFTNCMFRRLPWRRFPMYFLAQFLGGFVASGVVYANYINGINALEGHNIRTVPPSPTATAGIFCTYPQPFLTKASQFFSEFIASAILMFVIFALKDDTNNGVSRGGGNWFPLGLFFLIFGLGACFGWETGYAINLARDFGPRLMSYAVGYGSEVWSAGGYYFWIPIVAPFCGCLFGGFLYDVFIYTGPSPINTPWFGLGEWIHPKKAVLERINLQKKEGIV